MAFDGQPPNTMLAITVIETDSNEALAATEYPMGLAGASTWAVPVSEIPVGLAAVAEKKYRK